MKQLFSANPMWKDISNNIFKNYDMEHFRANGPNNRLAMVYNPKTHGLLFFKTILYNISLSLSANDKIILNKIKNRNFGNPTSINFSENLEVDIDYLQSLNEVKFLNETLNKSNTILEIGGGYGRSAHSILTLYPTIQKYFIIDLDVVLELAKKFLSTVLPQNLYSKFVFLRVDTDDNVFQNTSVDLCININSFQEMDPEVVRNYIHWIDQKCGYFYCNNTVGKFDSELCGFQKTASTKNALNSGLLQNKLNIFNEKEILEARKNFINAFRPSDLWECIKHSSCIPWPHYYQALYKKL